MKKGWEVKKLGEVLEVLRNGINCTQDKKGFGNKITRIETVAQARFDLDKVGYCNLSESDRSKYKIERGDILFSHINSPPHVGKTAYFDSFDEVYHGVNLLLMRPKKFMLPSYLEYFLKFLYLVGFWKTVCKQSVNQASVNQQDISMVKITFPESLPTQQRIVAILDEAFAAIEKARQKAAKNLQNARELFESYLENVFANPGDDWEKKKLGEVLQRTETTNPTLNPDREFIYIDVSSVDKKSFTIENAYLLKGADAPSRARKLVKSGDVIFATVRPTLRRIAVIPKEYHGQVCSTGYFVLRPKEEVVNKLLFYFLQTSSFNENMEKLQKGASYPSVTDNEVREQVIHFPKSPPTQQAIVAKLDALSAETKKLEAIYQKKLTDLKELKKSILDKAFAGELTD